MRSACLSKAITMPSDTIARPRIASEISRPLSLFEWLTWLNNFPAAAIVALTVVNLIVHWQTLGGYFLADDFVHVAWLKEVFNGHFGLVTKNFYSTWLQTEGTNFYRPFISVTLVIDRLLFGGSAFGYHLSNLFYQCLSTVGLYLVGREFVFLFSSEQNEEAHSGGIVDSRKAYAMTYLPLLSALLFAVHPLHAEVVSWIIARVDSVCCAFYLLAMWLFLKARRVVEGKQQRWCNLLAIGCFILSLISKEMAVTLPPALVLLMVLFPAEAKPLNASRFFKSVAHGFVATWQLWLILIVYLVFRAVALGSLTGGYQGSIGEGLSQSTLQRVFSVASIQRVFFPLNAEVFVPLKRLARPLLFMYVMSLLLFAARFIFSKTRLLQLRILAFSGLWFLLVMIPTIPVWNLTETLQGSRFIYMGTAPLCMLIAALFAPLWSSSDVSVNSESGSSSDQDKVPSYIVATSGLSSVIALAIVAYYGYIVIGNNEAWVHAGRELKNLRDELDSKVSRLPNSDKLALLNLPHRYKGAHMLYNAATLSVLLAPPLNGSDIVSRVATFEPVLFGDDDLIRISRVRQMIQPGSRNHFVFWDREEQKLTPIELAAENTEVKFDAVCQSLTPTDIDARGNAVQQSPAVPGSPTSGGANTQSAGSQTPANSGSAITQSPTSSPSTIGQSPRPTQPLFASTGHKIENNNRLMPPDLNIDPTGVDFLDLCLSARKRSADTASSGANGDSNTTTVPIVVDWNSGVAGRYNSSQGLITTVPLDGKMHRMRIHVSQHKKWLARGKVHRLGILSPAPDADVTVYGVALLNGKNAIPKLAPTGKNFVEDVSGVIRAGGKFGHVSYDVTAINGATGVVFEISKPNAWFEHYSNTYRDSTKCDKALKTWTATELSSAETPIELKKLAGPGFYELRVAATAKNGEVIGYFSDPILFQLGN